LASRARRSRCWSAWPPVGSNKEIARDLGLSPNTVKTHVANLYGKLEVSRRTQAVGKARELALIP
jgi:NarL family two-component system response regulator LiaR